MTTSQRLGPVFYRSAALSARDDELEQAHLRGYRQRRVAGGHLVRVGTDARLRHDAQLAKPEHLAGALLAVLGEQRRCKRATSNVEVGAARVHRELEVAIRRGRVAEG